VHFGNIAFTASSRVRMRGVDHDRAIARSRRTWMYARLRARARRDDGLARARVHPSRTTRHGAGLDLAELRAEPRRTRMRTQSLARWALAVLVAAPVAYADNDPNQPKKAGADKTEAAKLSDSDVQLLAHFHQVNQMEIELGGIAARNSKSRAVKNFASQIVDDHKRADRQIMMFAKKHGVIIPKEIATSESEQKEMKEATETMDKMRGLKGVDFDREYLHVMATDHDKEVANIDQEAAKAQNPDLAAMIKDMKPVLQRHADTARDLMKSSGQQGANPSSNEMQDQKK
jgi:putative membrane protein